MDILAEDPRDAAALLPHVPVNAPDDTKRSMSSRPYPLVTIQPYLAAAAAEALRVYF